MPRPTSEELQRARRLRETGFRDTVLEITDKGLQEVEGALAQAALAILCRPRDAAERIRRAQQAVRTCRNLLTSYYDDPAP